MKRFRVFAARHEHRETWFDVNADDAIAAEDIARKLIDDFDWTGVSCDAADEEVIGVMEVSDETKSVIQ